MKNDYEVRGNVTVIFVCRKNEKYECLVDTEDFCQADIYNKKWYLSKAGYVTNGNKYLHRILTNVPSSLQVDHINGKPIDNRKVNLRIVSDGENKQNWIKVRTDNISSGIRGVSYSKSSKKWCAYVSVNKKRHSLGVFDNIFDAERVVKQARSSLMPYSKESIETTHGEPIVIKSRREPLTKSGVRGVSFIKKRNKWRAEVYLPVKKYLGDHDSIDKAEAAIFAELATQSIKERVII